MRNFKTSLLGCVLILASGLGPSGCGPSQMTEKAAAEAKAQTVAENPVELVNQLDREISNARINQLNVLSPTNFQKAEETYLEAKAALDAGKEITDIRKDVLKSRTYLKQAEEMAKVSRTTLPEAIKAREMARSAGATKFQSEYADLENNFLDLTKAIEKNNLRPP